MASAKTIPAELVKEITARAVSRQQPLQDAVMFNFSFRAGLRACEIAGVPWRAVLDLHGEVVRPSALWRLPNNISKMGAGGELPMHQDLYDSLVAWRAALPPGALKPTKTIILRLDNAGRVAPPLTPTTANAVRMRLSRRYEAAGLVGCSSHSGRRTYVTTLARRASTFGCSIKDVQRLARHADLSTTEVYIEPSERVTDLVGSL